MPAGMGIGCTSIVIGNTKSMLKKFDPITFPTAISGSPFLAAITVVAISGRLVASATIVTPIKI